MRKIELLLPAGNKECLRAAVANGADAVYLGLKRFNARQSAGNFNEENIFSAIEFCHNRNVKVYVAFNTLVKNDEIKEYLRLINVADCAKADAVIIQDACLIPLIKKNFPRLRIHLSTQATITNSYSIPKADRVIPARELKLEEIKNISKKVETEIFVHGALCFSYSGQCLFSSIVGGRSGNRGVCAQPCRKMYNKKYLISTMDLCMLEKIPDLIKAGVSSFKIEGRMRSPLYVATVARIYRRAINSYYKEKFNFSPKDMDDLKLAFNREFTTGFTFNETITDSRKPMNRGLFIGTVKYGKLSLKKDLKAGDGIGIWKNDKVIGQKVKINAKEGDLIDIDEEDRTPVYKTSSVDAKIRLGDEITKIKWAVKEKDIVLPEIKDKSCKDNFKIFVKVGNEDAAIEADKAKADVVYYDINRDDCLQVKKLMKNAKFFVFTPRVLSSKEILEVKDKIDKVKPDGVLVGNKGLLDLDYELHLDYSFNCFNDVDLNCYNGLPIISPELSLDELKEFKNKNFITLVHGNIILMTIEEKLKAPELIDSEGRHFRVRNNEILNSRQIGLFNKARDYLDIGIKYFYIDLNKDVGKFVRIYKKILNKEHFDDNKIKKGYTTGHFSRGLS